MKALNKEVSIEIAKLLKKKGFDEKVNLYYDKYGLDNGDGDSETICINHNQYEGLISAPTIADVVDWCFNKYKYSIEYSINIPESGEYDGCYVFNGLIKGSEDYKLKIFYTSKDYSTVEKALEDTINHFLFNFC